MPRPVTGIGQVAVGRRDVPIVIYLSVRASSLRPLKPPEAYKTVPRRMRGCDRRIRREFSLDIISQYFPSYPAEIGARLGSGDPGTPR